MQINSNPNQTEFHLFKAAQALRNRFRQQIFSLLSTRNNMSFNELLENLNISRSKLAYHLQVLSENNIITNFYDKRVGVKDHSFYELSAFSYELITGGTPAFQEAPSNDEQIITEQPTTSANFRTIHNVKYKSYDKVPLKREAKSLQPTKLDGQYDDPLLGCRIIKSAADPKKANKIVIPSFRKYYSSYKHPFKTEKRL